MGTRTLLALIAMMGSLTGCVMQPWPAYEVVYPRHAYHHRPPAAARSYAAHPVRTATRPNAARSTECGEAGTRHLTAARKERLFEEFDGWRANRAPGAAVTSDEAVHDFTGGGAASPRSRAGCARTP